VEGFKSSGSKLFQSCAGSGDCWHTAEANCVVLRSLNCGRLCGRELCVVILRARN
jgi:hypothetical protein